MMRAKSALAWAALTFIVGAPIAVAATSPYLAWRDPIYIIAGFAGIAALALMVVQPLLVAGYLPGVARPTGRRWHKWVGITLLGAVILHVVGLWITSPPDVVDALLLVSPTPFSVWGVAAMWLIIAAAVLVWMRRRLPLRSQTWRRVHTSLVGAALVGTVLHALLIVGTMGTISKWMLCLVAIVVSVKVIWDLRIWQWRRS